jgi:hypothetical protein
LFTDRDSLRSDFIPIPSFLFEDREKNFFAALYGINLEGPWSAQIEHVRSGAVHLASLEPAPLVPKRSTDEDQRASYTTKPRRNYG